MQRTLYRDTVYYIVQKQYILWNVVSPVQIVILRINLALCTKLFTCIIAIFRYYVLCLLVVLVKLSKLAK